MKKFFVFISFMIACEDYDFDHKNDSDWIDLIDPQEVEGDSPGCLHCSELRRPEDYQKACTAARQLANMIAKCQCETCDDCPNECGWLDYFTPECAQGIDYNACEDYWILCEKDKP